jgi:RNA polymerase sigma-70 factor (ECF subfamily)
MVMSPEPSTESDLRELLERAAAGDREVWGKLFSRYRDRLRGMIALRLDRRLQGRIAPSDVVQEANLDASRQLADYAQKPDIPFYLWLRLVAGQKPAALPRHHLGTKKRDTGREVSLFAGGMPGASSNAMADRLAGLGPRPSEAAMLAERFRHQEEALARMDELDREVLALRHFEQLSNGEAARVLGLSESAASKRYVRALGKLKEILTSLPGGREEEP